jgi:hypothetical protein
MEENKEQRDGFDPAQPLIRARISLCFRRDVKTSRYMQSCTCVAEIYPLKNLPGANLLQLGSTEGLLYEASVNFRTGDCL